MATAGPAAFTAIVVGGGLWLTFDGQVVEMGSHDELVARGGEYAALWRAWQQD